MNTVWFSDVLFQRVAAREQELSGRSSVCSGVCAALCQPTVIHLSAQVSRLVIRLGFTLFMWRWWQAAARCWAGPFGQGFFA